MKRLIIALMTFLGACKGSDFGIAKGVNDAEAADIVAKCDLAPADYHLNDGNLFMPRNVSFERAQCVIKRVKALGKYSGAEVGNKKFVSEPNP